MAKRLQAGLSALMQTLCAGMKMMYGRGGFKKEGGTFIRVQRSDQQTMPNVRWGLWLYEIQRLQYKGGVEGVATIARNAMGKIDLITHQVQHAR